jgi:hypothetical protein
MQRKQEGRRAIKGHREKDKTKVRTQYNKEESEKVTVRRMKKRK